MAVRTLRAPLAALALAGTVVVAGPVAPSRAHAELISSTPQAGASLSALPAVATLTFTDEIDKTFVRTAVTSPAGTATVAASTSGPVVSVPLPAAGPGGYRVVYRVVSADGHPISGELRFTVAGVPTTGVATSGAATTGAATGENTPVATTPVTTPPAVAAPAASPPADSSGGGVPWLVAAVALVVAAGGGAVFAATRGRRS